MHVPLKHRPSCWIITEGLKGTENQCIGIAEMLGLAPKVKTITLAQPWRTLSPYLALECKSTFLGGAITPPYPDILITGGRKAIAASRYIKKKSEGKTFTIHAMDPKISSMNFDLVTVPEHDKARGNNIIVTKATPNRITVKSLQEGKKNFPAFGQMPSPRLAILIGGNSNAYSFDMETAKALVHNLKIIQGEHQASLMITMSRRTPNNIAQFIKSSLKNDHIYIWDEQGENPYFGFLAHADTILVTSDSTSMLSEACTTGKPTYMISLKETGRLGRIKTLQKNLIEHGALRIFDGTIDTWRYKPLNDSQIVANEVKKRLPDLF
jgi:mitochondrial fission protein ELM1